MNKANECTCPSGDGSLVHPCPAHPAVEQAGTNVGHGHVFPRADGVKMRCGGPALCSECAADAYRARAALAQPSGEVVVTKNESGAIVSVTRQDKEGRVLSVIAESATLTAQAEQAEAERPEGPTEDELEAAGLGYPLHKEEAVKLWYSGFRSEVITVLEAWEAIGHDIGMNPDKGELLDSLRYMLEKCEAHDAALARVEQQERTIAGMNEAHAKLAGLYEAAQAQHSVPELLEWAVDRWHAEVSLRPLINVHRRALDDTWRQVIRRLGGDTGLLCGPSHDELLAAAPGNSAQHSVPEGFIGRLSEFLAQRGTTGKALLRELRAMLAAAPAQGGE
ncbi:hypothetical protein [Pseudomonas aeruginosa]|uniref:hypothetical protein n=1 Tax=Pseudomonas aeruginosa TaxID=287 RepID=UPI002E29614A|nr:hypothetical protein [Pseudomonas aeruginosa]